MPQLQINQGPQDALLYDNTRSYFTNVGYTRTSNFQVEYRDVDSQNAPGFGNTVEYVIPKAADLLGPVDLIVDLDKSDTSDITKLFEASSSAGTTDGMGMTTKMRSFTQWVDELGFAMIERATLSVGSNAIETITGEQMQIKNELMTSDEMRLGYEHVMKTGRRAFTGPASFEPPASERPGNNDQSSTNRMKLINKDYTRIINYCAKDDTLCMDGNITSANAADATTAAASGTPGALAAIIPGSSVPTIIADQRKALGCAERKLIVPLSFFFTKHVSQYFPLAAIAGCNDIRISIKFRPLNELVQQHNGGHTKAKPDYSLFDRSSKDKLKPVRYNTANNAGFVNGSTQQDSEGLQVNPNLCKAPSAQFAGNPMKQAKLRCHYVHVTGPEATTLMNKEHVRLLKLWQHQHQTYEWNNSGGSFEMNLSFLHPVTTFIITIRRDEDMNSQIDNSTNAAQKGFFFYHGDGTNPNYDRAMTSDNRIAVDGSQHTVKVKGIQLTLNGQERHPGLPDGLDRDYLMHRLLPLLHSNSNAMDKQILGHNSERTLSTIRRADYSQMTAAGYLSSFWGSRAADANITEELAIKADTTTPEDQRFELKGSKNIFVYPFSLNPEGSNPSGAVNFSKVSHAKLKINFSGVETETPTTVPPTPSPLHAPGGRTNNKALYRVDVYGLYYNWLQIKDGRALLSFA